MSDNNAAIYGTPQVVSLPTGDVALGSYIVNDYLITVTADTSGNGYLLTIRKGSQEQTIHLTELTQEAVNAAISASLTQAKESGEFDGNGIESVVFNPDYTLSLYFTDGTSVTTGSIRGKEGNGIQGITMNPDYTLSITFTNGDIYTTDPIRGETGKGISRIALNQDYTLTITYTDGTSTTTGSIRGSKGDTGNGISRVIFNDDYTLTINFTDGTSYRTESIRGLKGDTGTGVRSTVLNQDYTLTINLDDGTSYTTPSIRGQKGDKGDKGDPGDSFELHICSSVEYDHETRIPTVPYPRRNVLYLVPSEEGFETDLFVEWAYIVNNWEKFGSASMNLDAYAKKTELDEKLNKPANDGLQGQVLTSDGSGGQTWSNSTTPDWNAASGTSGFIKNKLDLKAGTGTDSITNRHSIVSGTHSMATGTNNIVSGADNYVAGSGNNAKGTASILAGDHNTTELRGSNSLVGGSGNSVSNGNVIVAGSNNTVTGVNATANGSGNTVSGANAFAVGEGNTASGGYSHAEGLNSIASKMAAHAEGYDSNASANASHSEGSQTTASGACSHAEGGATTASGNYAHSEGGGTLASGNSAHAEGSGSVASGSASHAEGGATTASGQTSHSEGMYTIAKNKSQSVSGEYNVLDPSTAAATARGNYVEIIGNGTADNARSNARTLDWSGNEWVAGNFKMGGTSYDDVNAKEVATKDYVDDAIAGIPTGSIIDDTAGSGDVDKTWSADKITSELANAGSVQDVTVNGTSVVINGIAELPIAGASNLGAVKVGSSGGLYINPNNGVLQTSAATSALTKAGADDFKPITSLIQHESTFYGLAKAAGDTTQVSSSNAVGTYTDNAKSAIKAMLGVGGETQKVAVSGTAPTIVANQNTRYVCGEVVSLDFTPSAEGICDVIFTSGSTVAVLTIPNTVRFPEWFDQTSLEANKTYEISISDGVYGAVMIW